MVDHPREPSARRTRRQAPSQTGPKVAVSPSPSEATAEAPHGGDGDRVAKALARAGVASRREVERLIGEGRVALNGRVLDTPAVKISPADVLTVDGRRVGAPEPTRLWRYHKPAGLVTSHSDPGGRPTVFDALPAGLPRVISVGRLDLNSEGLLLLTNDGALSRALELPANAWVRQYRARAYGRTTQDRLDTLKEGITVDGVAYGPIQATLDKVQRKAGDGADAPANVWITVVLNEGKNREVRRVLEALDLKVNRLVRLAYGPFALSTLPVGAIEEVGPRVVREQLADFIAPENLPQGAQVAASPSGAAAPMRGAQGELERPEKKAYKPGWAKPKARPPRFAPKPGAKTRADKANAGNAKPAPKSHRAPAGATLIDSPRRTKPAPAAPTKQGDGSLKPTRRGPSRGRPPRAT